MGPLPHVVLTAQWKKDRIMVSVYILGLGHVDTLCSNLPCFNNISFSFAEAEELARKLDDEELAKELEESFGDGDVEPDSEIGKFLGPLSFVYRTGLLPSSAILSRTPGWNLY